MSDSESEQKSRSEEEEEDVESDLEEDDDNDEVVEMNFGNVNIMPAQAKVEEKKEDRSEIKTRNKTKKIDKGDTMVIELLNLDVNNMEKEEILRVLIKDEYFEDNNKSLMATNVGRKNSIAKKKLEGKKTNFQASLKSRIREKAAEVKIADLEFITDVNTAMTRTLAQYKNSTSAKDQKLLKILCEDEKELESKLNNVFT